MRNKFIDWLMRNEVLKAICGYLINGYFAGVVISLFGMIWLGFECSDYVFPKLLCTDIIIIILARAGWNVL